MTKTLPVAVPEVFSLGDYVAARCFGLDLVLSESPGAGTYTAAVVVPAGALVLVALLYSAQWDSDEAAFTLTAGDSTWIPSLDLAQPSSTGNAPQVLSGGFLPTEDTTLTAQVVTSGAGGSSGEARVRIVYLPAATEGSEIGGSKT